MINRFILYLNIFFSFFIVIIYISSETNPEKFGYFSLITLFYSPVLMINLIFIIYWILLKKIYFLISTIVIIFGLEHFKKQIQFFGKNNNEIENQIKLISFNTRNFINNGWDEENRKILEEDFIKILDNEKANIICLQEFPEEESEMFYQNYFSYQNSGTIILTKKEIINSNFIDLKSRKLNSCIYVDIILNNDTLRVYNMHLESIQINENDNLSQKINKIKEGNKIRVKQIEIIKKNINNSPYDVIVCGDMNDSPYSYAYKKLSNNLKDAFIQSGYGIGTTFKYLIPLRIDYIFHGENLNSYNFSSLKNKISDHKLIKCNIKVKK